MIDSRPTSLPNCCCSVCLMALLQRQISVQPYHQTCVHNSVNTIRYRLQITAWSFTDITTYQSWAKLPRFLINHNDNQFEILANSLGLVWFLLPSAHVKRRGGVVCLCVYLFNWRNLVEKCVMCKQHYKWLRFWLHLTLTFDLDS